MKPRFLIDVDQVLTLFVEAALPLMESILGRKWNWSELPDNEWDMFEALNVEQRQEMKALIARPGFVSSLKPTPGSHAAVERLHELCEVFVVTSPMITPYWVPERNQWLLEQHKIPKERIIHASSKYPVSGKFFLDDKPAHVVAWAKEHPTGIAMLWTTPHNHRIKGPADPYRVEGWDAVLEKVQSCLTPHS